MATLAVGQRVPAHQGEIRLGVDVLDIEYLEPFGRVALCIIRSQFAFVNVLMA